MALGDLSTDQQRYAEQLAASTGLDATVIRSWIGTESGWGTIKADHNYLNIGPGRQFTSTDQAAQAAASLVNSSDYYASIRSAKTPTDQIAAIGESKWGTSKDTLTNVYAGLATNTSNATTATVSPAGVTDSIGNALDAAVSQAGKIALALLFTAAGVALIGLGVFKLTSPVRAGTALNDVSNLTTAASMAAVV